MKTWFTSDLHFRHRNIVEYTQRGKETTQKEHDEWLINLWNSTVGDKDTVWHLGDFAFHRGFEDIESIVKQLKGSQVFFLKGNHDETKTLRDLRSNNYITDWYDYREIKVAGTKTVLFHFPISSWHGQGRGSYHLHGHCHGNLTEMHRKGYILDVGLDEYYNIHGKHGFFSEEEIDAIMKSKQKYIADHHADR